MKNLIRVLFGIPVILSIPIQPEEKPIDILLEGLAAKNNCIKSEGYSYCPSLYECVRPWEVYCKELDFPYNVLYQESGIIIPD
tara:strand:+ start:905 stop:1153 length:249 start_codon:yes stop_codon:yes gene_type:complete